MENFILDVEVEDDVLYISNEDGSGAKYNVKTLDDIIESIKFYLETYVVNQEEVD